MSGAPVMTLRQLRRPALGQAKGVQILLDYSRKWGLGSQEGRRLRAQAAAKGMVCWAWNEREGEEKGEGSEGKNTLIRKNCKMKQN